MRRQRVELTLERCREVFPARIHVLALRGIGRQIVELRHGKVDQLQPVPHEPGERRPVPRQVRVERLEVGARIVRRAFAACERPQTAAVHRLRRIDAEQVEQGRHHVDKTRGERDDGRANRRRRPDEERNADGRLVRKQAVRPLAMLPEGFAVIGGHGHNGMRERA